ncbi:glycosyltransferase family 2 protein [Pseudaestuariivita rosea]|uniref:glycosyltransferase family 2 protein n=1 Tax=Pseudaestuariivita rosea TaxID=2763263 RepID=UPI001ABBD1DB|nr:glycosyltransferase [Pseudaestuariivita rosea]
MTDRIAIAAATRGRPRMFDQLLQGLAGLTVPGDAQLVFIFVENDQRLTIGDRVALFQDRTGWQARAILESEQGIPFARNAALQAALDDGCDWLAFLDDDEEPATDWIARLLQGALDGGFDLCGGPVDQRRPAENLTRVQEAVWRYNQRMASDRSQKRSGPGASDQRLDLATNNWLCRLDKVRETGLRFDEGLRLTGGSDTDFSRRAAAAGFRLGWVADARVSEEIPPQRLTIGYCFRRARDQTMAKYHMTYRKNGKANVGKAVFNFVFKTLTGVIRVALFPILGSYQGLKGVRSIGVGVGWIKAALGRESRLYEQVTGD